MNIITTNFKKNQIHDGDWLQFEKQFLIPLSLTAVFFAIVSILLNVIIGFNWVLTVIPFFSIPIFLLVYLMVKNNYYVVIAKWIFIISTFIIINLVWYFNFGGRGPWLFLLILLYSYLIFMMRGKQLILLSLLIIANVLVLFIFEYHNPNALGQYPSEKVRILDFYSAILLLGGTAYVLMTMAKRAYLSQYKKAKTADKLKSSFLANMSHEIRTPLNAIVGFSNLLADGTIKDEEREQYIAIINRSNETLLQLIDDILDVSMIEAEQVKINEASFSVTELMHNLEKTYRQVLKEKNKEHLQLVLEMPRNIYRMVSDPVRVNQLMVNLLNNAIKFTEQGSVTFGFLPQNDRIKFFVRDTGIGIEKEYQERLFDRFYKIEEDNTKLYRGTGIGLYLCKKIAEMLGGSIHVQSEYGKGSEFYFYLPLKGLQVEPQPEMARDFHHNQGDIRLPETTILIVEDDTSSRIYFKKVLEGMRVHILEAADAAEGERIFREHPEIAVVLLDIRLPGVSGFEVLKELKKLRPEVPVIAQTAFAMAGDKEACLEAGFDAYISKPVGRTELLHLLKKFV